jgi:hypothetical protein
MAIIDTQKVDYLWKKLGYGKSKTDVDAIKNATNESIASPLFLRGDIIWSQSEQIPNVLPGASSGVVSVYPTGLPVECVADITASPNRTWKTNLIDWIPPEIGDTYQIKVYVHTAGNSATAASAGTQLFASGSGNNDEWFFDYQSGVLNFIGTNLPNGINFTGKSIYISGGRYTGIKGVPAPGAAISFTDVQIDSDLFVSGISTLTGDVELVNNLEVSGVSTFISDASFDNNLLVTGVSTFVGVSTYQNDLYVGSDLYVLGDTRIVGVLTVGSSSITLDGTENQINIGTGVTAHTDRVTVTQFRASGVSTFGSDLDIEENLSVIGTTDLTGDVRLANNLNLTGITTFNNTVAHNSLEFITNQSTYKFIDTTATTVSAFGQASSISIGATSGTTTLRSNELVGVNSTQNIYNTVATNINAFGNASRLVIGSTSGITTIQSSTVKFGGIVVDSIASNSSIFPSPTTLSAFAGASAFFMGPSAGGSAEIKYSTITLPNTTTLNVNGANPTIAASSTGTLSLFNSNISRVVAFGDATNIVIGSATTTGITTIRTNISSPNGIEASGLLVGIVTLFDSNFGINATNSGTSAFSNIDVVGVTTLGGRVDIFGSANLQDINSSGTFTSQNFEVLGISTFSSDVRISGDLIVDGTTVTVNSVTMTVDDKNIELGAGAGAVGLAGTVVAGDPFISLDENGLDTTVGIIPGMEVFVVSGVGTVATGARVVSTTKYSIELDLLNPTTGEIIFNTGGPTEFTADGGGITLLASSDFSNNKSFSWLRQTNAWSTQENINIESTNSSYLIAGASVLDFNTVTTPNAYHTGIITAFNVDLSSGIITAFNAVFGNIRNNFGLYAVGISSFNEAYISSGIVTGLTADYFTLTNTRSLIATQTNTIIGPSTNKIAIDTTGLAPEMRVFSSGPELLNNATILSIDEPGIITITPLSVNVVQTTTSTLTVYDDPQAGVASISVLKADVGIVTNFDTLNANITGITTAQRLYVQTDIYTPGISSANTVTARVGLITFVSGNNITYSGIGTISTLYSNVGFVTNIMGTNIQYTGISTLPNLITNVGFITHLSGTDIEYTGVSTLPNLITNVGFITTIYGNDLQLTGVTTVPTLRVNTGFVTTISGTRATYQDIDNTNFYSVGIASLTDVFANTGVVTTITGTDLNYSGIGTINDFYANFAYSGIGTIDTLTSNDITINNTLDVLSFISDIGTITLLDVDFLKVAGILTVPVIENEVIFISTATVSSIGATTITVEDLFFTQANSTGILTVTNLNAVTGFITSYTGTEIDVGVATVTTIENQYLNTSGIGTIENLFTNIGIVTTLTSDYILSTNYIVGIGSSAVTVGVTTTIIGISTADILLGDLISGPSGIETGTTVVGYAGEEEIIISPPTTNNSPIVGVVTFSRDNQAGVASITTLKTNIGFVTTISGTDLYYTGITTADNLYTNIGIVTFLSGTNLSYSGISSLGVVEANTLQINNITNTDTIRTNVGLITHLSGTNIEYTGISTLSNLITNVGLITYITGQNLKITGVTTSTIIRSEDLSVSGITTTNYLRVGAGGTVLIADASSGIGSVGINTSVPNAALHLYGDMQFNGNVLVGTISTTLTSNAEQIVQSLSSVDFRSVEYTVQVSTGNTHQITKILTIHDGVTAYNSEYSNLSTGVDIASFDVIVDNSVPPGYIGLRITPVSNVDPTLVTVNFSAIRI